MATVIDEQKLIEHLRIVLCNTKDRHQYVNQVLKCKQKWDHFNKNYNSLLQYSSKIGKEPKSFTLVNS